MLREEFFDEFLFAVFGGDDLFGDLVRGIVLDDERRKRVRVRKGGVFEREIAAPLHDAAAGDEDVDCRIEMIGFQRDDVRVYVAVQGGDPLQFELGEHGQLFAVVHGEFKLFVCGKGEHLFAQNALRLFVIAAQKGDRLFHVFGVFLFGDEMGARGGTAPEMIGETGLFGLFADRRFAQADVVDGRGDFENVLAAYAAHERPEIFSVPLFDAAGDGKSGKFLFCMRLDVRIGLVVF